ncbi:MAG TPA: hypothetical protein VFX65_10105 [Candidatus Limnocylindrales bacterium]|nr:hypothetical protein [Candidatus Limnocylindrales bacterium]
MTLAGSLAVSLLATLTRPSWWALALAGFLVRGGFLVVLLPIVRLPTVAGLANIFGPTLVGFVFAGPSPAFLVAVAAIAGGVIAWLILGGLTGAALDLALVRDVATDEELEDRPEPRSGDAARAFALRMAAHLPTAGVLTWGALRLVEATYQELIRPGDPGLPIPIRVALRIPEIVGLLAAAWIAGEAIGGLAVRHLAWGSTLGGALVAAFRSLVRPSGLATLVVTNTALVLVILGSGLAAGVAWDHLRVVLVDGGAAGDVRVALAVFSLTWVAGVWLVSLAVAWRAAAWTVEVARHLAPRTIDPSQP